MSILVTGSNGFLGVALIERLLANGQTGIRCFTRPGSDCARLRRVIDRYPDAAVEVFCGSLSTRDGAAQVVEGAEMVYHLAAATKGPAADLFLNTVVTSKNLLDALVSQPVRKVVLISSFSVYGIAR